MTLNIGLPWPIERNPIERGESVHVYVACPEAKRLLTSKTQKFHLEGGRVIPVHDGDYAEQAAELARQICSRIALPNPSRPICDIQLSDREEYDTLITLWPGNRANLYEALDAITNALQSDSRVEPAAITYLR